MSICYRTTTPVTWDNFFANLPEGITIAPNADPQIAGKCITDGTNYLWVHTGDGSDISFVKYGRNYVEDMIETIEDQFDTQIINEHHPDFFTEEDRAELEEMEEVE